MKEKKGTLLYKLQQNSIVEKMKVLTKERDDFTSEILLSNPELSRSSIQDSWLLSKLADYELRIEYNELCIKEIVSEIDNNPIKTKDHESN